MIELNLISNFPHEIIAVDEVGRGPLVGPVVIGAVKILIKDCDQLKLFLKSLKKAQISDSKVLSAAKRFQILNCLGIHKLNFRQKGKFHLDGIDCEYVTWEMSPEVIDQENILWASLRGMKEASLFLSTKKKIERTVLIDGNKKFKWGTEISPFNEVPIIKGDSKSVLIGLASIIAKEKRDLYMCEQHEIYPHYGFNTHFGYPTKVHREAIKKFGPSPIHRKTFKGVKEFI